MAKRTKAELKALFQRGDLPTAQDYADLIDSFLSSSFEDWPDELPAASAKKLTDFSAQAIFAPWVTLVGAAGYIDANTVIHSGDVTPYFFAGVRVRLTLTGGDVFTDCVSRSYDGGTDLTTIELLDSVANNTISAIAPSLFYPVVNGGPIGLGTLGVSAFATGLFDDADAAAARVTLGAMSSTMVRRVYTANDTWTKPAGLKMALVRVQGPGGGGGGTNGATSAAGGGGGGGFAEKLFAASALGATEAVVVGLGGAGSATGGGSAGTAATTFGTSPYITGNPGLGGAGNTSASARVFGGLGGTGVGGDLNRKGARGGFGLPGAGTPGYGGDSPMGTGAGPLNIFGTGDAGGAYGGGGCGGQFGLPGDTGQGGAGGNGVCEVWEFY